MVRRCFYVVLYFALYPNCVKDSVALCDPENACRLCKSHFEDFPKSTQDNSLLPGAFKNLWRAISFRNKLEHGFCNFGSTFDSSFTEKISFKRLKFAPSILFERCIRVPATSGRSKLGRLRGGIDLGALFGLLRIILPHDREEISAATTLAISNVAASDEDMESEERAAAAAAATASATAVARDGVLAHCYFPADGAEPQGSRSAAAGTDRTAAEVRLHPAIVRERCSAVGMGRARPDGLAIAVAAGQGPDQP